MVSFHFKYSRTGNFDKVMRCDLVKGVHKHLAGCGVQYMLEEYEKIFWNSDGE